MAGTRSSTRGGSQNSSPAKPDSPSGSRKRKNESANTSPSAKRGKKDDEPKQLTLEESMPNDTGKKADEKEQDEMPMDQKSDEKPQTSAPDAVDGVEMADVKKNDKISANDIGVRPSAASAERKQTEQQDSKVDKTQNADNSQESGGSRTTQSGDDSRGNATQEVADKSQSNGTAVETDARNGDTPSSILEKGLIYFFFRARVNVSDPQDVNDIARTYMVMRPIPHDAKLGDGTIGDDKNCRLLALPKKVLPLSGRDKFMTFVESAKTSFSELKDNFMSASDYATKTAGTSHTPAVTPVAEGVYALTTTGRDSHLAYIITLPSEIGELQKDIGIRERGSFNTSAKNPKFPGPANTNLDRSPDYPKEIIDEFRDLRWMPLQPKLLDFPNTQFLLIGESSGIEKATEALPRDQKNDKDTPLEELEKLEGEDELRVEHLNGNDAIFADLELNSKDYPKLSSTW